MAIGDKVYTRRSMNYGGQDLDSQQVIELKGLRNDDMLLELGTLIPVPKGVEPVQCGECGAVFVSENARERHGGHQHEIRREAPKPPLMTRENVNPNTVAQPIQ